MTDFIKADIFFFVTTVAVVCVSAVVVVVLVYVVKILKDIFKIAEKAKSESDNIIADLRELRGAIREEGAKLKAISEILTTFAPKKKKTKSTSVNSN